MWFFDVNEQVEGRSSGLCGLIISRYQTFQWSRNMFNLYYKVCWRISGKKTFVAFQKNTNLDC